MKAEIVIGREGSTGFAHIFPVQVALFEEGGYVARIAKDVPRMRPTTRYGEREWEHTSEMEFNAGDQICLSTHEIEECRGQIAQMTRLIRQTRETLST